LKKNNNMIKAEVIQDSVSHAGVRLTTLVLEYPRCIHAEVKTHRVFSIGNEEYELTKNHDLMDCRDLSRNAMSSRAIPVKRMIEQVRKDPFVPHWWGSNQPGMQAGAEVSPARQEEARYEWLRAAEHAAYFAESLNDLGLHKQIVNRLLEPFQWMKTIVTATEWENFFDLRDHPDAEPHFQALAKAMRQAMRESQPVVRGSDFTKVYDWHLPYVRSDERAAQAANGAPGAFLLAKISAARCARVSYLTHDGENPSIEKDLGLFTKLAGSHPIHASPLEHAAFGHEDGRVFFGNLKGWVQLRKCMEMGVNVQHLGEQIAS
jgi:hypothetical protein